MVDGWGAVSKKLQRLADEVYQAAPAGLFDAAAAGAAYRQGPSSATQMEQLQCITKVCDSLHSIVRSSWFRVKHSTAAIRKKGTEDEKNGDEQRVVKVSCAEHARPECLIILYISH